MNDSALSILAGPEELAQALADSFVVGARSAIAAHDRFAVALAGGTTPRAAYALLANEPRSSALPWNKVQVYFGDERCVSPTDDQSNYKMARDALLASAVPEQNVHRMRGEAEPHEAAMEYAALLHAQLGDPPLFDLVMLGMGADGHTASLFPGTIATLDDDALVNAVFVRKLNAHRLTLTPRAINAAAHVVIAVAGEDKAPVLAGVLEGPYEPDVFPVQLVRPSNGTLHWFVDAAAASLLKG